MIEERTFSVRAGTIPILGHPLIASWGAVSQKKTGRSKRYEAK